MRASGPPTHVHQGIESVRFRSADAWFAAATLARLPDREPPHADPAPARPRPDPRPRRRHGRTRRACREEGGEEGEGTGGVGGVHGFLRHCECRLAAGQSDAGQRRDLRARPAQRARAATTARPAGRRDAVAAGQRAASCSAISGPAAWTKRRSNAMAPIRSRRCCKRIDGIRRAKDVAPAIAALHQVGIPVLFNFSADVDLQRARPPSRLFPQGGLGLPDPAYYTRGDADTQALVARYADYVRKVLDPHRRSRPRTWSAKPRGARPREAHRRHGAAAGRTARPARQLRAEWRPQAWAKQYRNLQLDAFLKAQGVSDDTVSMANPAMFAQLDALVAGLKPAQWKTYLRWRVGDAMAPYLAKPWRDAAFEFRGKVLRGETAPAPRWQQVLDAINQAAGPMLGREYAARYLPDATRQQALVVAKQVRDALATQHRQQHLDERSRQGRSRKQARQAADRNRHPAPRPRLQRAADGPRQFRRQHADRLDLAASRGNEADRPRQRRPSLGRAAAAARAGLRPRAEPADRDRGDAAGPGAGRRDAAGRAVRRIRGAGRATN